MILNPNLLNYRQIVIDYLRNEVSNIAGQVQRNFNFDDHQIEEIKKQVQIAVGNLTGN